MPETMKKHSNILIILFFALSILVTNMPGQVRILYPIVYSQLGWLRICVLLFSILLIFIKKEKPNGVWWLAVLFYVYTYGRAILFPSFAEVQFSTPINILALCTITYIGFRKYKIEMYTAYTYFFLIVAFLQIFFMIPDLNTMDSGVCGLFTNRNYLVRFFLPGTFFVMMHSYEKRGSAWSIQTIFYLIFICISIVLSKSATGMIGVFIFLTLSLLYINKSNKKIPRFLSVNWVLIYTVIFFLLIICFDVQEKFAFLIVDVLNKDLTFTGRTIVWEEAIGIIKNNPIWGIGETSNLNELVFNFPASHAHQYWLQLLVTGGIVGCLMIYAIYFFASKNIVKHSRSVVLKLVSITIICFLIMGIDESLIGATMLMPLLVLAYERPEKSIEVNKAWKS